VDDSPPVLRAAREAGIRWVYAVRRPDSTGVPRVHDPGFSITDGVRDLTESLS